MNKLEWDCVFCLFSRGWQKRPGEVRKVYGLILSKALKADENKAKNLSLLGMDR